MLCSYAAFFCTFWRLIEAFYHLRLWVRTLFFFVGLQFKGIIFFRACSFVYWMFAMELTYLLSICSEPSNDKCKTRKWISDNDDWTTILVRNTSKLVLEWLIAPHMLCISLYNLSFWVELDSNNLFSNFIGISHCYICDCDGNFIDRNWF